MKLCWDVPEATHTLFVEHLLGEEFTSLRVNVLSRYVKFFQSLVCHSSREVALVANLVGRDIESTTGRDTSSHIKNAYKSQVVLDQRDSWKIHLLKTYLEKRQLLKEQLKPTDEIEDLVDSLCTT